MRGFFTMILLLIIVILLNAQPRLTIVGGTRLNSNNNTSSFNVHSNICWVNNTVPSNINLTNVTVRFTGTGLQYIGGNQPTPFYNLRINKSGTGEQLDVYLDQDISIANQLYMEAGYLDLRNNIVTFSSSATLENEGPGKRVKATDRSSYSNAGTNGEGYGTGYITTTRNNPTGNVANLGLDIISTSGNFGTTEIRRGHQRLQGTGTFSGNLSVSRYYRIIPATMQRITNLKFYYIQDGSPELFTHPANQLIMYQSVQYWNGSPGPIYWEPQLTTPNTGFVSSSTTSNPIMLNYILITLGSTTYPLPVEYLTFYAVCKSNINTIYWQTASETNNYGFIIEKSNDGNNWDPLAFVEGKGTVNSISSYQYDDLSPYTTTYYRLKQVDLDGAITYSNPTVAHCNEMSYTEDFYPVYASDEKPITIVVKGIPGEEYQLLFTNLLGQQLLYKRFTLSSPQEVVQIFDKIQTTGIYYITMVGKQNRITKPMLYQPE